MSKLEQLINELCPQGVEYKSTNDVKINSFWLMPATPKYIDAGIPYITSKNIKNGKIDFDNVNYISQEDYENMSSNRNIYIEDILITMIGTIGEVCIVNQNKDFYGQNLYLVRLDKEKIITKYFYYFITSASVKNSLITRKNASSQGYIRAGSIENLEIPLPPLPVQEEIVRILDSFTELTAELTAELTMRKQQYEYYRETLFNFENSSIKVIAMGDESIGKFTRGSGLQKKDFTDNGVGCIHYGQIYTYYGTYTMKTKTFVSEEFAKKARIAKYGDLIIATTSENDEDVCKAVAWLGNEGIAVSSDACFYTHKLNPKYVAYFFQTEQFQKQKRVFITGTKVRRVNVNSLEKILIPVPSLEEQQRIVDVLDRFDTLVNDIKTGLPAEIEARKQQYEYYRDKLLTFKKLEV